jgi:hypothetical protein
VNRHLIVYLSVSLLATLAWAGKPPLCSVVSGRDGGPAIIVDGKPYSPIMFAMNNQFNRDDVLIREWKQATAAGFNLYSFGMPLGSKEEVEASLAKFCAVNPEGYFYVRIWVATSPAWLNEHPDARIVKADGTPTPWASLANAEWRKEGARQLEVRLSAILESPYADRFLGVCLTAMQTGEWFYYDTNEFMDYSQSNLEAFRAWLKAKYGNDKRLREAWSSADVTLKSVTFPSAADRDDAAWGPFRDTRTHRRAMDMQEFQRELVADTIGYFAKAVKDATNRRSLVGAFYGYTFELNHNGPRALANSGHLALARVLANPDIDLIHAPYSYFERSSGQPGHFHLPVDSIALSGKLAVLEDDTFTHLSVEQPDGNLIAPGWDNRAKTFDETLDVTRRNFGNFLTHRCGFWYFDLLSDGRWDGTAFWESTSVLRRMAAELRSMPPFAPEVAFVASETAPHLLRDTTHPYLLQSLGLWRSELARLGAPVGYYLQSDLPRLPLSVKLVILANPYSVADIEKSALEKILARGGTVVWTYAPDLVGPNGPDPARMEAITGMPIAAKAMPGPLTLESKATQESWTIEQPEWDLRFYVSDARNANIMAVYKDTGDVAVAATPMGNGVSVYAAVPRVPVGLLRVMCEKTGVHIYTAAPCMTGVIGQYFIVHTGEGGQYQFRWPTACSTVERVVPSSTFPFALDSNRWGDILPPHSTAIYRCVPRK